jgi:hypothetical protein
VPTGAPRAKHPAVVFATLVVFGHQKKLLRNRNSAICAHIATASLYKILKPRSMPKVELSMFGVVAGDWGGAENKFRVLFASWACCDRICRRTMQVSMAWMRAESGGEGRSLDVVVARVCQRSSRHMDRTQRWWNAWSTRTIFAVRHRCSAP